MYKVHFETLTPEKAEASKRGGIEAKQLTDVKLLHPEKASDAIQVTEWGIATDVNPLHPEKASALVEVTELGTVTDVSALHPPKTLNSREMSEAEIEIAVNLHTFSTFINSGNPNLILNMIKCKAREYTKPSLILTYPKDKPYMKNGKRTTGV